MYNIYFIYNNIYINRIYYTGYYIDIFVMIMESRVLIQTHMFYVSFNARNAYIYIYIYIYIYNIRSYKTYIVIQYIINKTNIEFERAFGEYTVRIFIKVIKPDNLYGDTLVYI